MARNIKIYKNEEVIEMRKGTYCVLKKEKFYSVVVDKELDLHYFLKYQNSDKTASHFIYQNHSEEIRPLNKDIYIIRVNDKDILYDASKNSYIGESHDHIYQTKILDNDQLVLNQDLIFDEDRLSYVTSYMTYDGNYLGSVYDSENQKYYDANSIQFDYPSVLKKVKQNLRK